MSLATLRAQVAVVREERAPVLPFGIASVDESLADRGLGSDGLHEIAAASPSLADDAAATLFVAGIAARFAAGAGAQVLWALTRFDLYAPGLEQAGLGPNRIFYAQGAKDAEVLAAAEDALRDGSLVCVVAEVRSADMTMTRRLQLAASDSRTPMLLYKRYRARGRCPLSQPSCAMTRWRIGCAPSQPLAQAGLGHAGLAHAGLSSAHWNVELVRQRGGAPFFLELEACDATGRLAMPAATRDRAVAPVRATSHAA
nr:protein ImuA [Novosphingobium sp. Rr 2-17]